MTIEIVIKMFILIFLSYFTIRLFIKYAPQLGLLDKPNHRSAHKTPTPRGAGIVFGALFLIALAFQGIECISLNIYVIIATIMVYVVGIVDDFKTLEAKTKLMVIIAATLLLYMGGYEIDSIGTYFGHEITLGWLALPFTVFAVVAFTNAVNLTDGLDGLAGSISLVIASTIFFIGVVHDDTTLIYWSAFLIAVLIGFLFLNWHPAKVFMGDSGSLFLGFIIAVLALQAFEYVSPTAILFFAAMPILDTLIVFRRRIQRGMSPFTPDKNHIHHVLFNAKQDKAFTVKMLLTMQIAFSALFLQLYNQNDLLNLLTFVLLFILFFNLFDPRIRKRPKGAIIRKKHKEEIAKKKKNKKKQIDSNSQIEKSK